VVNVISQSQLSHPPWTGYDLQGITTQDILNDIKRVVFKIHLEIIIVLQIDNTKIIGNSIIENIYLIINKIKTSAN